MVLWARLMTALGRFKDSRRAWKRVINTGDERYLREAVSTMDRLPQ